MPQSLPHISLCLATHPSPGPLPPLHGSVSVTLPSISPPPTTSGQGVRARIRCRWFSGYSVHRRVRWAWWHCRPHGLKLLLSAWFPLASSTSEDTWVLRWHSDLRSDVGGLWVREAHNSQGSRGHRCRGKGTCPCDWALLGRMLMCTVPGHSPGSLQGLGEPLLAHPGPGHQISSPGRGSL